MEAIKDTFKKPQDEFQGTLLKCRRRATWDFQFVLRETVRTWRDHLRNVIVDKVTSFRRLPHETKLIDDPFFHEVEKLEYGFLHKQQRHLKRKRLIILRFEIKSRVVMLSNDELLGRHEFGPSPQNASSVGGVRVSNGKFPTAFE